MAGFKKGEEVFKAGYLNEDFAAAKLEDGVRMVATGEVNDRKQASLRNMPINWQFRASALQDHPRLRDSDRRNQIRHAERCTIRAL